MNCPVCTNTSLVMTERQGVEIDYCPQGRGVWLDRGELDKIIERSNAMISPQPGNRDYPTPPPFQAPPRQKLERDYDRDYDDDRHRPYGKKKRGFFSDLFEFD